MPESITIIFNHNDTRSMTIDPLDIDSARDGEYALEELIDYLNNHHISYFHKYISYDEMESEEERLIASGAREVVR